MRIVNVLFFLFSVFAMASRAPAQELSAADMAGIRAAWDAGRHVVAGDGGASQALAFDAPVHQTYFKASNPDVQDQFGRAVALSGDTVVVGAYYEDSSATGVNGDESDNGMDYAGAAYVFVRTGGTWSQQAYLKASNPGYQDFFGSSVAISGDTIVVGAEGEASNASGVNGNQANNSRPSAGAAYVFVRQGTTWSQQAYLKAPYEPSSYEWFGASVAVSGDTVAVGVPGAGSGGAVVYVRNGTAWSVQDILVASNAEDGDFAGLSLALSGNTLVVGASWEASAATGVNGNQASNGAAESGAAYVYVRNGAAWSQQAYLKASDTAGGDRFGRAVAISGDTIVAGAFRESSSGVGVNVSQAGNGAPYSGAAYVFVRNGTNWSQQASLKASNTGAGDEFGSAVAVSGDTIVVGAYAEDSGATGVDGNQFDESAIFAGAAYVFERSGGAWTQSAYLKPTATTSYDYFGYSLALEGSTLLAGAIGDASAASGIDGDPSDHGVDASGAVFLLDLGALPASLLLTSGVGGTLVSSQSFNETRGLDVTVLSDTDLRISAMTLHGLSIGGGASGVIGARIYGSGGALVASAGAPVVGSAGEQTVPILATLASGATYRVAFFVSTTPNNKASGQLFVPDAFPYVEASGRLRINSAHSAGSDSFPANSNSFAPRIQLQLETGDWTDLGHALAGAAGEPHLAGTGELDAGSENLLQLAGAKASAPATLVVGVAQLNAPFKGGTLVPSPLVLVALATNVSGAVTLPFETPPMPAGATLYFQFWIPDAGAVAGVAASNALKAVAP